MTLFFHKQKSTVGRLFKFFLLCFLLFGTVILSVNFGLDIHKERINTQNENEQILLNLSSELYSIVLEEQSLAESISQTEWGIKMSSTSGVWDSEITPESFWKLKNDFLFYPDANEIVGPRCVYFVKNDELISHSITGSLDFYLQKIGFEEKARQKIHSQIENIQNIATIGESRNGPIFIVTPIQKILHPKSYLITQVRPARLKNRLMQFCPDRFKYLSITDQKSGVCLCAWGQNSKKLEQFQMIIPDAGWEINVGIDKFSIFSLDFLNRYYFYFAAIAIASSFLAVSIADHVNKPIKDIQNLLKISGENQDSYIAIQSSIVNLQQELKRDRRTVLLNQLLNGYFESTESIENELPFKKDFWYQVYVVNGESKEVFDIVNALENSIDPLYNKIYSEIFRALNGEIVLIFGAEEQKYLEQIRNRLKVINETLKLTIKEGTISRGLIGISISYQVINEAEEGKSFNIAHFYFPLEWEGQFIKGIRTGNITKAEEVFDAVVSENERRFECGEITQSDMRAMTIQIAFDLNRCIFEMNLSKRLFNNINEITKESNYRDQLSIIHEALVCICEEIQNRVDEKNELGILLTRYIRKHYCEEEISLQKLCDLFEISSTTVNKEIRKVTGKTFLRFVTDLRMTQADMLIKQGEKNVSKISAECGYENEYSFRRAFNKYYGCKVQEYIEINTISIHAEQA